MIALGSTVTWHEMPLDRRHTRRIVTIDTFRRADQEDSRKAQEMWEDPTV